MAAKLKKKAKAKKGKRKSAKRNPSKRKVLHGAAKIAHAKKVAAARRKRSAKKNPARKRKASGSKRKTTSRKKSAHKRVTRATQGAKRNPSPTEFNALKNKVGSIDSRLYSVEKKQTKFDRALSGLNRASQIASGR